MKKYIYHIPIVFLFFVTTTACNFLDIVPDEIGTEEDAFKDTRAAERYLYACYSYIPNPRSGTSSLDLLTGDEVVTAFEHETFANFPKGNYTANNPVISYWSTLFMGIKQCYILKNNIHKVPAMPEADKKDYMAQADFLIAYYHYLLLRCYGPIILIKEEPLLTTPPDEFLPRSGYDECVEWIAGKFDEAAKALPDSRMGIRLGLATSNAAKSIKSRMYLYAASPLFNGNSAFYADFKKADGTPLISNEYSASKWIKAKEMAKEAIDAAEKSGYRLYASSDAVDPSMPEPKDPTVRTLRFNILDKANKETIWAETREEGNFSIQGKSRPWWLRRSFNGICPTLAMLDRFYTENGLPIDQDPSFKYESRFTIENFPDGNIHGEGQTSYMNLHREPRYYAWISFHGGYYECLGNATGNATDKWAYLPQYKRGVNEAKLVTFFKRYDNCGRQERTNNFSYGGFLNKKGVSPRSSVSDNSSVNVAYPWPIIRLAELYLNYAEACVETNELEEAKKYINKIRERAGIPSLEDAWGSIGVPLTQEKMREIVRQERMIELYLENHNFWDMRRWLLAATNFSKTPQGLNTMGTSMEAFSRKTDLTTVVRNFVSPTHYLMPIPYSEVQRNINLIQNPGY